MATLPTCAPLLNLSCAFKRWGSPRRRGLYSHPAHFRGHSRFQSPLSRAGYPPPPASRGCIAKWSTCGPFVILSPALQRWGPAWRQWLCSHPAHLWSTSKSFPCCAVLETLQLAAVMSPPGTLLGHFSLCPPTRWGPCKLQGLCSHPAQLWATSNYVPRRAVVGIP